MSTILAIDLGKFNSVFCWYDPISKATEFSTVPTHEPEVRDALLRQPNVTVVVEACSPAGWVHDIAVSLGLKVLVGAVCELARVVSAVQEYAEQVRERQVKSLKRRAKDMGFELVKIPDPPTDNEMSNDGMLDDNAMSV